MDGILQDFLKSGRALITNTKTPKVKTESVKVPEKSMVSKPLPDDPHKVLVRRAIQDLIQRKELVEEFKKIIAAEEALL